MRTHQTIISIASGRIKSVDCCGYWHDGDGEVARLWNAVAQQKSSFVANVRHESLLHLNQAHNTMLTSGQWQTANDQHLIASWVAIRQKTTNSGVQRHPRRRKMHHRNPWGDKNKEARGDASTMLPLGHPVPGLMFQFMKSTWRSLRGEVSSLKRDFCYCRLI